MALVTAVTRLVVVVGATLMRYTDPANFPTYWTGLWWAVTTVTTVGYGDVAPITAAGRLVAVCLMFVGIGCFAFMTAVAASAIVISEEQEIESEAKAILVGMDELKVRLDRIEATLLLPVVDRTSPQLKGPASGTPRGSSEVSTD